MINYPHSEPPQPGQAIKVAEGILWLRLPLPMRLDHVNIYALDEGDSWTLIDAGMKWPTADPVLEALRKGPLGGKPISRVVITHHHPDHVGYLGDLVREGAQFSMTRTAFLLARMLTLDTQETHSPEALEFYKLAGMSPERMDVRRMQRPFNFSDIVSPIPVGYERLEEGSEITMGGRTWDIRVGHGHAPEHATFWCQDAPIVLSGDQIIASISPNVGVYPSEPGANSLKEWLESCERFATLAREDHLVLGGHKLIFTGLPERMAQLIDNHEGALARLREFLRVPATAEATFMTLFKREIGDGEYALALGEAIAHCQYLWFAGEATRTKNEHGAWIYQTV